MTFLPGRHRRETQGDHLLLEADACVVGAGAGGAAAALALARAGLRVAVIEEGRHWAPADFRATGSFALRHLFRDRGTRVAIVDGRPMPVLGGVGVGGGTLINSAISFPTPDKLLDAWAADFQYGAAAHRDAQAEILALLGVGPQDPSIQGENNLCFARGAEALGRAGDFLPRSTPGCVGCGLCNQGCPTGGKASVDRSLLVRAERDGTVGIWAGMRVRDAVTRDEAVVAVTGDLVTDGVVDGTFEVRAPRFVVSLGAVETPRFLLRNGLATGEHCGRHLHLHPGAPLLADLPNPVRMWRGTTQGYYLDRWEQGYLLETSNVALDQLATSLPFELGSPEALGWMARANHLAAAGVLTWDASSEGEVGRFGITYTLHPDDKARMLAGLRETAEIFFGAGATRVLAPVAQHPVMTGPLDIRRTLRDDLRPSDLLFISSHCMGTARMGASPATSVTSREGRVWGWSNLYVADASLMPGALGVNPQITVMSASTLVGRAAAA